MDSGILWPSSQTQRLLEDFQWGRTAHAYLLTGPAGVGKRSLASLYGQALFCLAEEGLRPCGNCPPCKRYLHGNHPDSFCLASEKSVGVDEVRELTFALSRRSYEEGAKLVRILEADRLTPQAQNALLKTLEEPPGRCVFILTSAQAQALLPTIRSRCLSVPVPPLSVEDTARLLRAHGISQQRAELLSRMSEGVAGRALALEQDREGLALRERVLGALSRLRDPGDALSCAATLKEDKDKGEAALDILEYFARELLRARLIGETRLPSPADSLAARVREPSVPLALLEALALARKRLANHLPWQTVLEALLLTWIEVISDGEGNRRSLS